MSRLLLIGALALTQACENPFARGRERLYASATNIVLVPGDTMTLGAILETGGDVRRTSPPASRSDWSRSAIDWRIAGGAASISADGRLRAEATGTALLWLRTGDAADSATITVVPEGTVLENVRSLSAGGAQTCATTTGDQLYCWGSSWSGETGHGAVRGYTATLAPALVHSSLRFRSADAGGTHSCALSTDREIFCWGENVHGQLGDGTTSRRAVPARVSAPVRFTAVSAGNDFTCALALDASIWCWGRRATGRDLRPSPIASASRYTSVSAGGWHACAVREDGAVECWGTNAFGQLGIGSLEPREAPAAVPGDDRFVAVSAGSTHTCALTEAGEAVCWGQNYFGQLGVTGVDASLLPMRVAATRRFAAIGAGKVHTCAVDTSGAGFCWGNGDRGQLGDGADISAPRPPVGGPAPEPATDPIRSVRLTAALQDVSVGHGEHSCAVTVAGRAHCWGSNTSGQLGSGRQSFYPGTALYARSEPQPVVVPMAQPTMEALHAGEPRNSIDQ